MILQTQKNTRKAPAALRARSGALFAAFLVLGCLAFGSREAAAQADVDRLFEIRGVSVDEQSSSAAAAQAEALVKGRREAWNRLVQRLVPIDKARTMPHLSDDFLTGLTVGYEVARERTSDVRYLGQLNFRFNPVAVRQYFASLGIAYAEVASQPVLILPVYNNGSKPLLWEEESPWLAAWLDQNFKSGLVPIIVPYGDLADIRDINAVQATLADREAIKNIAARYGAEQTVIANARMLPSDSGPQSVELNLTYVGGVSDGQTLVRTVTAQDGNGDSDVLAEAARVAASEIQEAWKAENLISPGLETRVTLIAPLTSFDSWLAVRKSLDDISSISKRDLLRLSRKEALLDVWINGDADQLALALKQQDFIMVPWQDSWLVYKEGTELPPQYQTGAVADPSLTPQPQTAPAPAPGQKFVLPPLVQ